MRLSSLALLVALASGCALSKPAADPAVTSSAAALGAYLEEEGLIFEPPRYSIPEQGVNTVGLRVVYRVAGRGGFIAVYPFSSDSLAQRNTFRIAEAQQPPGRGGRSARYAEQRTYQQDRLVVQYEGADPVVWSTLQSALGEAKRRRAERRDRVLPTLTAGR